MSVSAFVEPSDASSAFAPRACQAEPRSTRGPRRCRHHRASGPRPPAAPATPRAPPAAARALRAAASGNANVGIVVARPAVAAQLVGDVEPAEEARDDRLVELAAAAAASATARATARGVGHDRRCVDDDHRVDRVVVEDDRHRSRELLGGRGCRRGRSGCSPKARPGSTCATSAPCRRELLDAEPGTRARVGGEDARSTGVADDRDSRPARNRLRGQHLGGVEQLLERVDADHARPGGTARRRRHPTTRARRCASDAARLPAARAAALHRDDRLAPRDTPRDPRELARVPERLEVEQDHVGAGIVLPVLEQVVAADVALVADRDELRDADPARRGLDSAARCRDRPTGRGTRRCPRSAGSARRSRSAEPRVPCSRPRGSWARRRASRSPALATRSRAGAPHPRRPSRRIRPTGSRACARACARTRRRFRAPRSRVARPPRGRPDRECRRPTRTPERRQPTPRSD